MKEARISDFLSPLSDAEKAYYDKYPDRNQKSEWLPSEYAVLHLISSSHTFQHFDLHITSTPELRSFHRARVERVYIPQCCDQNLS